MLDGFMAESLLTLQAVPAEAVPGMLASSADLAMCCSKVNRTSKLKIV